MSVEANTVRFQNENISVADIKKKQVNKIRRRELWERK